MISKEGKTIVVLGATRRQGGQVTRHLVKEGWKAKGITRKPESKKAVKLKPLGVEVFQADMNDQPLTFMELMTDPSYYQNVIWSIWPKITGGDRKIPWISVQDVGTIAAKAFAHPAEFMDKDFVLSADAQSLDECRAIYKEVRGKYPSRFPMPMFLFEKFVGKDVPRMWSWLRTHPVDLDTSQTRQIHPEVMSVRTWLSRVPRS